MFTLFLFRMALSIDMDIEASNSTNLSMSNITETNHTGIIKCEPNLTVSKEETLDIHEKVFKELLSSDTETSSGNANVKTEVWSELCQNEVGMVAHHSDVNSTTIACQIDPAPGLNNCNQSAVFKSEPIENDTAKNPLLLNAHLLLPQAHDKPNIKKQWNELWDEPVDVPAGLSKRQKKKYIRKVLWETKWKPLRRAKEKEKLKEKKLKARINNETLGPSRKMLKHSTMAASKCKLRIALDFSFDDLMSEKDLSKCLKQLNHCYCLNRRAANPLQFYVTNFCGAARDQLGRGVAFQNWDINFYEDKYLNIFKKEDLVYLTSDSDNTLAQLDHSKVYIIGALVDHNRYKGKTLEIAKHQGINHAKLPISEFLQMNSRSVLTIDHVFEILVHASGGVSWKDSFLKVLPPRKKAMVKLESR